MNKDKTEVHSSDVALPATVSPQVGGSDSRSETLSPREWPTLIAEWEYWNDATSTAFFKSDWEAWKEAMDNRRKVFQRIETERRRRPRGVAAADYYDTLGQPPKSGSVLISDAVKDKAND